MQFFSGIKWCSLVFAFIRSLLTLVGCNTCMRLTETADVVISNTAIWAVVSRHWSYGSSVTCLQVDPWLPRLHFSLPQELLPVGSKCFTGVCRKGVVGWGWGLWLHVSGRWRLATGFDLQSPVRTPDGRLYSTQTFTAMGPTCSCYIR